MRCWRLGNDAAESGRAARTERKISAKVIFYKGSSRIHVEPNAEVCHLEAIIFKRFIEFRIRLDGRVKSNDGS